MKKLFKSLTKFEKILWGVSLIVVLASFLSVPERDYLTLIASLVGVSALIFISKGNVVGQFLVVIFALLYSVVSVLSQYYGEMITYLFMSTPMAICAIVSWIKHPYSDGEVEVNDITKKQIATIAVSSALVTVAFYFILGALGTANLIVSTISVLTSFVASYLTFLRSPYYALGYALNDVVLIVLWILATIEDVSSFPMILCFVMFLVNDLYGFINWRRIKNRQQNNN